MAHRGYGWVTGLITGLTTVTSQLIGASMQQRQLKRERHDRERAAAEAEAARQSQLAAAKAALEAQQLQTQIAQNATGGVTMVDAHGMPLPASGVSAGAMLGGGLNPMLLVGAGVLGLGLIFMLRRR